jgi:nonsense-mediated mRNA decay protein 3
MVRDLTGKRPEYFEAIIQLRDCTKEAIDFVEEDVRRTGLIVTKKVEFKNGSDYYMSDTALSKALGKKLQEKFGGEYLVTATLHTQKDSKEIYRVTILFRQAHFRRGDLIAYNGDEYIIKAMSKDIFLQEQKTGRKLHLKYKEMKNIKKV